MIGGDDGDGYTRPRRGQRIRLALSPWHLRQEGSASPMLGDTHMMGEIPLFGGESAFLA